MILISNFDKKGLSGDEKFGGQYREEDAADTEARMKGMEGRNLPTNTPTTQQELNQIEEAERRKVLEEDYGLPVQQTEYKPPNIG